MKNKIVALLSPNQSIQDVVDFLPKLDAVGYELGSVVNPTQIDSVTIHNGTFVVNHLPLACNIGRTGTLLYNGTLIHSQALEISQWKKRVS